MQSFLLSAVPRFNILEPFLSKQGSSSLMHLILLKVEDCPTTCYYFCCFTQISYRLNCKENHAHVKVCVIYAYTAV